MARGDISLIFTQLGEEKFPKKIFKEIADMKEIAKMDSTKVAKELLDIAKSLTGGKVRQATGLDRDTSIRNDIKFLADILGDIKRDRSIAPEAKKLRLSTVGKMLKVLREMKDLNDEYRELYDKSQKL